MIFLLSSSLPLFLSLNLSLSFFSLRDERSVSERKEREREIKRELKERDKEKAGVERECLPSDDNGGDSDEGDDEECGGPLA